jgi:hypothetical protein
MRYENRLWHVVMACGLVAACTSNNDLDDDPLISSQLDAGRARGDQLTAQFNSDISGASSADINNQIIVASSDINGGAIEQAQFAVQASADTTTIDYANQSVNAYNGLTHQLAVVSNDLQAAAITTGLSNELTTDTAVAMSTMQTAQDLNLTYLQNQVRIQQGQLVLVETMLQEAQASELSDYLAVLRATLIERITRAAQIIHDDF